MDILNISLQAGALIAVVALVRTFGLHKLPKPLFLSLWGLVLFRLLIPLEFPFRLNVHGLVRPLAERQKLPAAGAVLSRILPEEAVPAVVTQLPPTQAQGLSVSPITLIWLAGAAAIACFFIINHLRSGRVLRQALPMAQDAILDACPDKRLQKRVKILRSDRVSAALTAGIFRPRVILPSSIDGADAQALRYVMTHELEHIRALDILWKALLALALCVHWFNPLVWLMFMLANRDLELACDARVIRRLGPDAARPYALALLDVASDRSRLSALYAHFNKNPIEERIVSIMKWKKATALALILSVLLLAGLTAALALDASPPAEDMTEPIVSIPNADAASEPAKKPMLLEKVEPIFEFSDFLSGSSMRFDNGTEISDIAAYLDTPIGTFLIPGEKFNFGACLDWPLGYKCRTEIIDPEQTTFEQIYQTLYAFDCAAKDVASSFGAFPKDDPESMARLANALTERLGALPDDVVTLVGRVELMNYEEVGALPEREAVSDTLPEPAAWDTRIQTDEMIFDVLGDDPESVAALDFTLFVTEVAPQKPST